VPVGVLVPVRGFAPYLAEALDSVLSQEPAPAQVVVVDDGSCTPLELHADHAPRVTLVRREVSEGLATARATAVGALRPEVDLVALCDGDDAWAPGKLAAQLEALAAEPDAVVCFGRAEIVGPDGRLTGERWPEPRAGRHEGPEFIRALYEANPLPVSSALIRRSTLDDVGGFVGPTQVAEDWELWLRIARAGGAFVCAPGAVVRYRRHPAAMTADVTVLAEGQRAVHTAHADVVDADTRRRVDAADLAALAAGHVRERRWRAARQALRSAAALRPLTARERVIRAVLAVPGLRTRMGRSDPYR